MHYEIHFSSRSIDDLNAILDYLDEEWGTSVSEKFLDRVDELLDLISITPRMFSIANKKRKIHKCVVNSNISLYYRIYKKEVELITFFHNRKDPSKFKL